MFQKNLKLHCPIWQPLVNVWLNFTYLKLNKIKKIQFLRYTNHV